MKLWPTTGKTLGLGKNGTYEAAARGEIPGAFRIGGRWLVAVDSFEEFLRTAGQKPSSIAEGVLGRMTASA